MTRIVVQKYGGTSVADERGRSALAARVAAARETGASVVVVVSAMGREGAPYATDSLLSLLAGLPGDDRERDMLAACGEVVSAVLVAHELREAGMPASAFTGADAGILTDDRFGSATILGVDPTPLRTAIANGFVPVVTGFQGSTADGRTTTLGRGGSDTTACAIGAALEAEVVEIYTDVDGVMSADPRECDGVRVLERIEYEELFQMAHHGAKVMHAPAAELAMDAGVPLRIRSTFSDAAGTLVETAARLAAERAARVATAVSHVDAIAQLRVAMPEYEDGAPDISELALVFRALADARVSLDMFTPCGATLMFTVSADDLPSAMHVLDKMELPYEIATELAKVTLVGSGMRGVPGVMARVSEALRDAEVPILQTADSHTTISVLVCQDARKRAVTALHEAFALGE